VEFITLGGRLDKALPGIEIQIPKSPFWGTNSVCKPNEQTVTSAAATERGQAGCGYPWKQRAMNGIE